MFKYELGDKMRDVVSGFTGIVTTRSEFLNGCIRYGIQPDKLTKDGKPGDSEWFDEKQLKLVKSKAVTVEVARTGGPAPVPRLAANPK